MAQALVQVSPVLSRPGEIAAVDTNQAALCLVELIRRVFGCERVSTAAIEPETTPVTSIKANLHLVLRRVRQAREAAALSDRLAQPIELLERMKQQARRLGRLLDDVIDLARIRAGKREIKVEPCDLRAVLSEVVQAAQTNYPERTITIETLPDQPVRVQVDPGRIGKYSPIISRMRSKARCSSSDMQARWVLRASLGRDQLFGSHFLYWPGIAVCLGAEAYGSRTHRRHRRDAPQRF